MKSALALALLLAACSGDGGTNTSDAHPQPDAAPTCPAPATPLAAGTHELFVSFEGVTLTLNDCDDATTNCSSLVANASQVIPAFLDAQGNRTARIATIKGFVQDALAPFSIDVVTTRPASGDYWMVSVGGTTAIASGTPDPLIAVKSVCDATNKHGIALVFEQPVDDMFSDRAYADTIAGALGRLVGALPTMRNGDCMCTQASCTHTQTCTWGTGATLTPGNACDRTSQNEQLLLIDAAGCR